VITTAIKTIDLSKGITLLVATGLLLASVLIAPVANAWVPDKDLMTTKGYSPYYTHLTGRQVFRQEWKPNPEPKASKWAMAKHNFYYNNWTGSLFPFGETELDDKF
jgi:hypothetical protein